MKIGDRWVSLNALQTFEVTARHQHMGRAAEELKVTQSAVSHQVRALESSLGLSLFDRRGRRIELNSAGRRLLQSIQSGFDEIASAALSLSTGAFSGQLSVAVPVSLMVEWLAPKLSAFLDRFPDLSLRLSYSERSMTTLPADLDLAVFYSAQSLSDSTVTPLMRTSIFPVCAPELTGGAVPLHPGILTQSTIIHEDEGDIWAKWFASRGLDHLRPMREIHAGSHHDAVAFARNGVGFAMTDWLLGGPTLRKGGLVQAFGPHKLAYGGYYIALRPNLPMTGPAQTLAEFLIREASEA